MLTLAIFAVLLFLLMIDVPIAVAIGLTAIVFFVAQVYWKDGVVLYFRC